MLSVTHTPGPTKHATPKRLSKQSGQQQAKQVAKSKKRFRLFFFFYFQCPALLLGALKNKASSNGNGSASNSICFSFACLPANKRHILAHTHTQTQHTDTEIGGRTSRSTAASLTDRFCLSPFLARCTHSHTHAEQKKPEPKQKHKNTARCGHLRGYMRSSD